MKEQLNLFEMSVLRATSKTTSTSRMYKEVQSDIGVSDEVVEAMSKLPNGKTFSDWKRKMRWIQQTLKRKGYIENTRNGWKTTGKGRRCLTQRTSGMRLVFYTNCGLAIWGESAMMSGMFNSEIDLIITSPPYPLTKQKEYSNFKAESEYIEDLVRQIEVWIPMLSPTGSIVLNVGDTFTNGGKEQSLYKERLLLALNERLGLSLMQRFESFNPSKLPQPMQSVCIDRTHTISALESFYWLSPYPESAKSNNRNVLNEYTESTKKIMASNKLVTNERKQRPSGNSVNEQSMYKEGNGGSLPGNLLYGPPEGANSVYHKYCRDNNLPIHPCRFPSNPPEHLIRLLTEEKDVVMDPFGGSVKTGAIAEKLNRNWICVDRMLEYLLGGAGRFDSPTMVIQ